MFCEVSRARDEFLFARFDCDGLFLADESDGHFRVLGAGELPEASQLCVPYIDKQFNLYSVGSADGSSTEDIVATDC